MNGNGWFFVGALVGIVVTVAFEVILAMIFDLPSRGIDDDAPSASEVVERHTGNVRRIDNPHPLATGGVVGKVTLHSADGVEQVFPLYPHKAEADVIDIRFTSDTTTPRDAGRTTVGHALGVVLVLGAFLLLLGLCGGVEGAGVGL